MAYTDRYVTLDGLIVHLDVLLQNIGDPILKSQYVGFLNVAVVTVFELAVKDIFFGFFDKKARYIWNILRECFGKDEWTDIH